MTYLSVSYDYGLIESYIYFRVIVLVKCYVYRVTIAIQLYIKKFEVYKVMYLILAGRICIF